MSVIGSYILSTAAILLLVSRHIIRCCYLVQQHHIYDYDSRLHIVHLHCRCLVGENDKKRRVALAVSIDTSNADVPVHDIPIVLHPTPPLSAARHHPLQLRVDRLSVDDDGGAALRRDDDGESAAADWARSDIPQAQDRAAQS